MAENKTNESLLEAISRHSGSLANTKAMMVPPPFRWMVAVVLFALFIIITTFDFIAVSFASNVYMNGIIWSTWLIGTFVVIKQNLSVDQATRLLREADNFKTQDGKRPSRQDLVDYIDKMGRRNAIIDNFNFRCAIANIERTGRIVFSHNDAKIFKSKVGQRLTRYRGIQSYISGLLLLLGLLGTFVGLLATIGSVADIFVTLDHNLTKPAASSTENPAATGSPEQNADQQASESSMKEPAPASGSVPDISPQSQQMVIVQLIKDMTKPLQGMATAFSSSLFGLSGSIIITLMTLFLNRNLNAFIERLSYWTDLHLDNSPTRHASSLREQYISISAPDEIPSQGLPLRQNQSLGLNSTHEFSSDSGSSGLDAGMFEDHHYITSNLLEAIEEQLRQLRSDIRRNSRIIVTYVRSPVVMQYIDALKNILDKQTEQNSKGLHEALHLLAESQETQAQNMERLSRELANTVSSMKRSQQKMASSPDKIEE